MTDKWLDIDTRGSYFPGDWVRPRFNPGTWMAMVDIMEIFPGQMYNVYSGNRVPRNRAGCVNLGGNLHFL